MKGNFVAPYSNSIRLRFAYYSMVNLATITSLILGACQQMFFAILANETEALTPQEKGITLIMTLMVFWIGAVLCNQLVNLGFDSIDDPPLRKFSGLTASVVACVSGRQSDLVMITIFEIVPIISAVALSSTPREHWTFTIVLMNYVIGALGCNIGAVSIQVICTLWKSSANEMRENSIKVTDIEVVSTPDTSDFGELSVESNATRELNLSESHPCFYFWGVVLFDVLLCIVAILLSDYPAVCMVALVLSLLGLSVATSVLFPRLLGPTYYAMVVLFTILTFNALFLDSTGYFDKTLLVEDPLSPLLLAPHGTTHEPQTTRDVYPLCLMRWGHPEVTNNELKLTAVDLAGFAYASYFPHSAERIWTNLTQNTAIEDTQLEHIEGLNTVGGWAIFKIPRSKVVVFAIRGTSTLHDAMAGMDLLANVGILQLANKFVPILELLPTELIRKFVAVLVFRRSFGACSIWTPIIDAAVAAKEKANAEGYEMVVTGHSLGGIFAAMVGATTSSPTLAFSSPGVKYNVERFGILPENFEKNVVIVQPAYDPISEVDVQLGLRQNILCNIASPLKCHLLPRTQCELVRTCGDPRGRKPNMDELKCAGAMIGA